jgi:multiple sugar transport system substrate-binding protein
MSGATLVDRSGQSLEPVLSSPEVVEAAERYLDLARVEEAMFTGYESGEPRQVFALIDERRTAMWTEEASRGRRRGKDFRVGALPFPTGEEAQNLTWAQGLVMSAGTDHPRESWRWLTFLSRQQPTAGDMIPSRKSVAERTSYWEGLDDELRTACQYALEHPLTWWTYEEISGAFYHAIREALAGKSVKETLSEAQRRAYEEVTALVQTPSQPIEMIPLEAERSSQAEAVITFLPFGRRMSWEPVIEAFTSEHPDIAVEIVSLEGTHSFQKWAASADCFTWVGPVGSSPTGVLSPEPFLELEPDLTVAEFYAHSVAAFQWEGRLWALPGTASPQVIFYNKEFFDDAGVPYPQLDWTWDDFAAQADLLTSRDENRYGFLDQPFDSQDVVPLSLLFPVVVSRVGSTDAFPLPFDDPRVVDAVAWYFDMMPGTDALLLSIEEGKVAMWTDLTSRADYYVPDLSYEVGMAPVPGGKTQAAAVAYLGYFISEETQHPDASWEWVKFLSTSLVPQEYGGRGWGIPTFRPLVKSTYFEEMVGSEEAPVYRESLEYEPISLPAILGGDSPAAVQRRWEAFVQTLVSVARGAEIEPALRNAETRIAREE